MALGKKEADTTARLTHEEREARYTEIRAAASAAALQLLTRFVTSQNVTRIGSRSSSNTDLQFGMT